MSDKRVFEPQIRARLVTTAHLCTVLFLKLTQVLSYYDHCTFVRLYQGVFEFVPGGFTCVPGKFLTRFRRAPSLGCCGCFVCGSEPEGGSKPVSSKLPATQRATAGFPVILCSNFRRLIRRDSPMSIRCCLPLEGHGISPKKQPKPVA